MYGEKKMRTSLLHINRSTYLLRAVFCFRFCSPNSNNNIVITIRPLSTHDIFYAHTVAPVSNTGHSLRFTTV